MNGESKGNDRKEFRKQAVKLVLVDGLSYLEASRRFWLSDKTLGNWVDAGQKEQLTEIGKQQKRVTELTRVKRELAVNTMEDDVLKNVWSSPGLPVRCCRFDRTSFASMSPAYSRNSRWLAMMESART